MIVIVVVRNRLRKYDNVSDIVSGLINFIIMQTNRNCPFSNISKSLDRTLLLITLYHYLYR